MFAGHDTTASAMTWFCYCIARHPEEQEKVMEELDRVFGNDHQDWDRPCTNQDLSELKYLECCIKETLRLYPSVPAVMRSITEDIQIGKILFLKIFRGYRSWPFIQPGASALPRA